MKKDWILIICLILLSLALWGGMRSSRTDAEQVQVTIDGVVFGTYDFKTDQTVLLPHHTLIIENGTARLSKSDCVGQDCVKTGAISRGGQAILCLPYRLNVQVSASASRVDAVTY